MHFFVSDDLAFWSQAPVAVPVRCSLGVLGSCAETCVSHLYVLYRSGVYMYRLVNIAMNFSVHNTATAAVHSTILL